jgi:hypothetical protein
MAQSALTTPGAKPYSPPTHVSMYTVTPQSNPRTNPAAAGVRAKLGSLSSPAIRSFQAKTKIKQDGVVGHQTAEAMLGHPQPSRLAGGNMTHGQVLGLRQLGTMRRPV